MSKSASVKRGLEQAWPGEKITRRKVAGLVPYARNARTHSDAQVSQIMASIEEWGWTVPILIDEAGGIIAGHGRVLAAQRMGIDAVPCMVAKGWSDEKTAGKSGGLEVAGADLDRWVFDYTFRPWWSPRGSSPRSSSRRCRVSMARLM